MTSGSVWLSRPVALLSMNYRTAGQTTSLCASHQRPLSQDLQTRWAPQPATVSEAVSAFLAPQAPVPRAPGPAPGQPEPVQVRRVVGGPVAQPAAPVPAREPVVPRHRMAQTRLAPGLAAQRAEPVQARAGGARFRHDGSRWFRLNCAAGAGCATGGAGSGSAGGAAACCVSRLRFLHRGRGLFNRFVSWFSRWLRCRGFLNWFISWLNRWL